MSDPDAADLARLRLGLPPAVPGDGVPALPPAMHPLDDLQQQMAACVTVRHRASAHELADGLLILLLERLAEAHPREGQILEIIGLYQDVIGLDS